MVRRVRKKLKRKPYKKRIIMPEAETSSHGASDPNATLSPRSVFSYEESKDLLSEDRTEAPDIGQKSEDDESYAQSYPALIDKYISRTGNIPFISIIGGAVVVISYVLIQDNSSGNLTTLHEVLWAIAKAGIILGFFLLLLVITFFCRKLMR
ncbi:hypothetical protein ACFL5Z_09280 [Planctomycetota bacterium]